LLDARRERLVRAADLEGRLDRLLEVLCARGRDRLERGFVPRDFAARDLLELALLEDFFDPDRWDFVSPFSRRILFTVRAATSSARPPYRPDFLALCLMCLYCRSRFGLAPRGIRVPPSFVLSGPT
jgi:hypothetical protein